MSELADDEPNATIVFDFVYDRNNTKQQTWIFFYATSNQK